MLQLTICLSQLTGAALIAQKRAEIAAKMAAMKNTALGAPAPIAAPLPVKPIVPKVHVPSPTISSGPTPASRSPASASGTPALPEDLARKVAEAKRRVADAQSKLAVKDNPYMASKTYLWLCAPANSISDSPYPRWERRTVPSNQHNKALVSR